MKFFKNILGAFCLTLFAGMLIIYRFIIFPNNGATFLNISLCLSICILLIAFAGVLLIDTQKNKKIHAKINTKPIDIDITNNLRIFNDCVRLITTSKNTDTVNRRYSLLIDTYSRLKKYSKSISDWKNIKKQYETLIENKDKMLSKQASQTNSFNLDINALNENQKRISDYYYGESQKSINSFNPHSVDPSIVSDEPLTSVECAFLKYVSGRSVDTPNIAQYWKYDYNINYLHIMSRFFNEGYLKISDVYNSIESLKVAELKEILRKKSLSVSGKKSELIKKIKENFSTSELEHLINKGAEYYMLTERGYLATKNIKKSITKNLELEDQYIKLILEKNFKQVYYEIQNYELSDNHNELYLKLLAGNFVDLPQQLEDKKSLFYSSIILGDMLGTTADKIYLLFIRLSDVDMEKDMLIDIIQHTLSEMYSSKSLSVSQQSDDEKYEFLATLDKETCPICGKLDKKVFKVKDAKIGVNFPPIHEGCRCTTVPYFDDEFTQNEKRAAEDPITGKTIEILDISYEEYKNKYLK